jgi:hypothetical protein
LEKMGALSVSDMRMLNDEDVVRLFRSEVKRAFSAVDRPRATRRLWRCFAGVSVKPAMSKAGTQRSSDGGGFVLPRKNAAVLLPIFENNPTFSRQVPSRFLLEFDVAQSPAT